MTSKTIEQAIELLKKNLAFMNRHVNGNDFFMELYDENEKALKALQDEPQVDVADIIGDFDQVQFLLGYPQLEKKDAVVLGHFLNHLQTNSYLRTPPEPIEGLEEALKVVVIEDYNTQGGSGILGAIYCDDKEDAYKLLRAAKAYAELTSKPLKGKDDEN